MQDLRSLASSLHPTVVSVEIACLLHSLSILEEPTARPAKLRRAIDSILVLYKAFVYQRCKRAGYFSRSDPPVYFGDGPYQLPSQGQSQLQVQVQDQLQVQVQDQLQVQVQDQPQVQVQDQPYPRPLLNRSPPSLAFSGYSIITV